MESEKESKKLFIINPEICLTCRMCVGICPKNAIKQLRRDVYIDHSKCNKCKICIDWCPAKAISFDTCTYSENIHRIKSVNTPQHLNQIYDIIIVGGGIAGLSTGISTLWHKLDLKILMLEKKRKIGEDVNSSSGTWHFTLDMPPLTNDEKSYVTLQEFTKFGLSVENESVVLDIGRPFLRTIDFSRLLEVLSEKFQKMGGQIETNSFVDSLTKTTDIIDKTVTIHTNGIFVINVISNGTTYPLRSKLLVDASGIDSSISRELEFHKGWNPNVIGVGAEYEMTWEGDPNIIWFIRLKHRNLGYAWSFPIGNKKSRVGISGLASAFKNNNMILQEELDLFIHSHFLIKQNTGNNISRTNFKCGAYPMIRMADKIVTDNAIRIGDAASQANPILGEGIYYAIKYGIKAGEILANTKKGDIGELKSYENYVLRDNKKFEEDKIGYNVDYDAVVRKLNKIKDDISEDEKWAFLSFIMPLESNWNDKLMIATKILGYRETLKLFGKMAKRKLF